MASKEHTFYFDVLTMGSKCMIAGIKDIFESDSILKVCGRLFENLVMYWSISVFMIYDLHNDEKKLLININDLMSLLHCETVFNKKQSIYLLTTLKKKNKLYLA